MPVVSLPQLAFGAPQRDPLYTSSPQVESYILMWAVALRPRLFRLTHVLGCVQLSQLVQQFLTRLWLHIQEAPIRTTCLNLTFPDFPTVTRILTTLYLNDWLSARAACMLHGFMQL